MLISSIDYHALLSMVTLACLAIYGTIFICFLKGKLRIEIGTYWPISDVIILALIVHEPCYMIYFSNRTNELSNGRLGS